VAKVKWAGATNFASAGDDKCVKVWDIMASAPLHTFVGHKDYVRALEAVPDSNLLLSGSLDGTARLWDSRVPDGVVATFKHGSETSGVVYSVLPLRGGTMFLTAGGSGIKVWDITAGSEVPVKEAWNHQKEVTSLCPNADGSRVLAGGLDGHIKVYDTATWKVVHGMKYSNAILSVALSVCSFVGRRNSDEKSDEKHLAVGMSSSLLSLRSRMIAHAKSSLTAVPPKRVPIKTFRDYQSITPADEAVTCYHSKFREADR
jgi:U3 small nucleolar RNA-associated protein 15